MLKPFLTSGAICSLNSKKCLIGWGEQTWSKVPLQYPCWYAPDFFLKEKKPFLQFAFTEKISYKKLLGLLKGKDPFNHDFRPPDWSHYDHFFEKFKQSGLKKAVPYVAKYAKGTITSTCLEGMLHHCLCYQQNNLRAAAYGFWNQEQGMLGATPELILSIDKGGILKSDACAGTMPVEQAHELLSNSKLIQEHQMVIEGLENALSSFGKVSIGSTEIACFTKIAHLFTRIEVKTVFTPFIRDIITKIHPSPAIGVFPKEDGMQQLMDYEKKVPRGRFGAPFGILESEDLGKIYLAIRNIQWEKEKMKMMAGGGIVKGSLQQDEKNEIECKFTAIHDILGL